MKQFMSERFIPPNHDRTMFYKLANLKQNEKFDSGISQTFSAVFPTVRAKNRLRRATVRTILLRRHKTSKAVNSRQ